MEAELLGQVRVYEKVTSRNFIIQDSHGNLSDFYIKYVHERKRHPQKPTTFQATREFISR